MTVLESGLGLVPLITGIVGLFEGSRAAPDLLTKYAMPDSIQFEGDTNSGTTGVDDFDQMGVPRGNATTLDGVITGTYTPGDTTETNGALPASAAGPNAAQQTMAQPGDPQWFMDHSSDIAKAVRSAMLNLSSINDVVNEL